MTMAGSVGISCLGNEPARRPQCQRRKRLIVMANVHSLVRSLHCSTDGVCVEQRKGRQYVSAKCLELGTSSCGDTIEEALSNLEEAISFCLDLREVSNG